MSRRRIRMVGPGDRYPKGGHPHGFAFSWSKGRVLSEYQALHVTRGEGEFESKRSGRKIVPAGSVVLLFPGVWHRYRPIPNVGWDEYWVSFNGEYIERLIQQGFFSPKNPFSRPGLDDLILRGYLTLLDRLHAEPVGFEQLLAATVVEILAAALGAVRAGNGQRLARGGLPGEMALGSPRRRFPRSKN